MIEVEQVETKETLGALISKLIEIDRLYGSLPINNWCGIEVILKKDEHDMRFLDLKVPNAYNK